MANVGEAAKRSHEYELGHSERELRRLSTQAKLIDPMTRSFFCDAGIGAGMRVLDIGSGAGDVAFLVADLVGAGGEVVGTDRSAAALAAARERAKARSLTNVSFREGDPTVLAFDRPFDAIVGRYVLLFSPEPAAMLKGLAGHVRPGGVIVFHEPDMTAARSFPPAPTYDRCWALIVETFRRVGTSARMGLDLHSTFVRAGLPAPTMGLHALIGGPASSLSGLDLLADLAITMAPVMEQTGVAAAADLALATLHERMRAEMEANGSIVVGRHEVAAWTRVP